MRFLDNFDFSNGQLPPWLAPLVSLTRPMATTLTAMIIPVGAASCGVVAAFSRDRALAMAEASGAFMQGVPEPLYYLVGIITTGYFGAKTAEAIKAPRPVGGSSPERPAEDEDMPPPPVDTAPRSRKP